MLQRRLANPLTILSPMSTRGADVNSNQSVRELQPNCECDVAHNVGAGFAPKALAARLMLSRRRGGLLFTSSVMGTRGVEYHAHGRQRPHLGTLARQHGQISTPGMTENNSF